jgi:uncharacterized membrane protein YiaA
MNEHTRRIVGWVIVAVGVVIAIVGALADQIGLGGDGPDEFGGKQIAALVVGVVIALIGIVVALWPARKREAEPA